ncbi:MAG: transglutaminase-like domain-containing protein, partial [Firmicutes bacterium]|nr:transglutaminase-like domain-containing protein [Bacillota bacterium]
DTQDVPYLQPGQDYVDQFLFVTHRGYCDNFSSALAVLARAVGIPSRWVKGFVTVPPDPHYHGKTNEYVLRGTDAHSWAEIWFAGYGWIPMEATPSFVLPQALHQPATQSLKHPVAQHRPTPKVHPVAPRATGAGNGFLTGGALVGGGLALLVMGMITLIMTYLTRRRRLAGQPWDESAERIDGLLVQVLRLFGRRKAYLTLREYAQGVEDERLRGELLGFVAWYERWRYGGRLDHGGLARGQKVVRELALHRRRRGRGRQVPTDSPTVTH